MATALADGKVLFAGMYPAAGKTNTEALLRHISVHYQKAQKVPAQYQLSSAGLHLSVTSENGAEPRSIKIPMQNIRDIAVNPYSTVCLMTIFTDPKGHINFLVCECQREEGAAKVVRNYRRYKQSVTGEGYKIDLKRPEGHNWLLKTDHRNSTREGSSANGHTVVQCEPEELERTPSKPGEEHLFDVGVQADSGDPDSVSLASSAMREEILQMSQEVRDIQNELKNVSISQPEYIGQEHPPNGHAPCDGEGNIVNHDETDSQKEAGGNRLEVNADVHVRKSSSSDGDSETAEKRVNFDPVRTVIKPAGYVSRSYGVQTEGRRYKYSKRQQPHPGSVAVVSFGSQKRAWNPFRPRSRSSSNSSNPPSPLSPGADGHNEVFEKGSHRGSVKGPVLLPGSLKSTVVRPIENVYPVTIRRPRSTRSQIVLYPGDVQTVARRTSSSSSGGNMGVPTGNPRPIRPVSFTAPSDQAGDHNGEDRSGGGDRGEAEVKTAEK